MRGKWLCARVWLWVLVGLLVVSCAGAADSKHGTGIRLAGQVGLGREMRGVWIATVDNLDWPSRPCLAADVQRQEFRARLDEVRAMHLNTVVVQVRPMADAFYPSHYAPWSRFLTGMQGKNPGYDPLAFMLAEAHKRGLAFHAWFNPYRVANQDNVNVLVANHPARSHPDWLVHYGGQLYYNPGIPAVREFVINSILEVVRRYAIDAVHLDDYFYPYPVAGQAFPDQETYQRYGTRTFATKGDWRRDNINQFVHELSQRIKQLKPRVEFGISPFGVWRNKSAEASGSDTRAQVTDYDNLYADIRHWIRQRWLDYVVPQIYWNIGFAPADYQTLVRWWAHEVDGSPVQLYIGQAAYKVGTQPGPWSDPHQIQQQLQMNRHYPLVRGSIFFSLKDLRRHPLVLALT
ncbi:hypothetical protein KDW_23910 [Dictyobacter vulcani]|uniref:Glycosyl hydrolase-like 10 domain-containing protein n=1 Tax=Dictyobacter vulcani TaxID=2607529 RepID=A0A5J4KQ36_9CHLR|nr:family 10 glycosylhydrolase [Dictyobacter vulcani]GER88229.1 hypothetical protein KDW_23910 [Dictyobacter vulcani]